tara:strand:- start:37 stop:177 length:141 start_codon:yes stop_codon:yes gene_type:complete
MVNKEYFLNALETKNPYLYLYECLFTGADYFLVTAWHSVLDQLVTP